MTLRNWTIQFALLALLTGGGLAQPPGGGQGGQQGQSRQRPTVDQIFQEMDQNNDQKISQSEAKGPLQKDFSKIDTDGDGYLSRQEVKAGESGGGEGRASRR
jgi:hypothetical protein